MNDVINGADISCEESRGTLLCDASPNVLSGLKMMCDITVRLLDFPGICRISPADVRVYGEKVVVTPDVYRKDVLYPDDGFTAPELKMGRCVLPEKALVYSVGALIFYLISGREPRITDGLLFSDHTKLLHTAGLCAENIGFLSDILSHSLSVSPEYRFSLPELAKSVNRLSYSSDLNIRESILIYEIREP